MDFPPEKEEYLGDGLYASFDGYAFTLRAPRESGDHFVVLEPDILARFIRYTQSLAPAKPEVAE